MYYVVTGACGFIGANLVKALNERGISDIIAVDNLTRADKFLNLADCEIADYLDKREFLEMVSSGSGQSKCYSVCSWVRLSRPSFSSQLHSRGGSSASGITRARSQRRSTIYWSRPAFFGVSRHSTR